MNKELTEMVFIIDKSGSMAGLEADTVGGFNSMLERQKREPGRALVSTVLFDDESSVLYDRVELDRIEPMTEASYCPGGCTALLDAIGGAVQHIRNVHKYAREEDVPAKTVFVITTDGMENASRSYTYNEVQRAVKQAQERDGWEFLFLGANMDAVKAAGSFGIREERAVRYNCDGAGTALNFRTVSKAIVGMRSCGSIPDSWKEDIDRDYAERKI